MFDIFASLWRQLTSDTLAVVVELLLIAAAVNWCVGVLQGTRGTRLFRGILVVLVAATLGVRVLAEQMEWTRLALLYRYFIIGLAFMALVAFQPELRRAFIRVGDVRFRKRGTPQSKLIAALVESLSYLSRNKFGALVAIQRGVGLRGWAENGTILNADVSANLLKTIFYPTSALHDLGVIVQGTRVLAAGCQFPQAESDEVDPGLGSRHRAAVGLSQESDALVVVVSEETGAISIADNGKLIRFLALDDVADELEDRLSGVKVEGRPHGRPASSGLPVWRTTRRILLVALLALVIWYLADQASLRSASVTVEIAARHTDPDAQVDIISPASRKVTAVFRGSTRSIRELQTAAPEDSALRVEWTVEAQAYPAGQQYQVPSEQILATTRDVRSLGLVVERAIPPQIDIRVDSLVRAEMPIRVRPGDANVTDVVTDPRNALVTMRKSDLDRLAPNERVVNLPLDAKLRNQPTDQPLEFKKLPLSLQVGSFTVTSIDPPHADVSLRIVGREMSRQIDGVVVRATIPPAFQPEQIEFRDPEQLVSVTVRGDRDRVQQLSPTDISAYVDVSSTAVGQQWQSAEVFFRMPDGISLDPDTRRPTVEYRVKERATP